MKGESQMRVKTMILGQ